MGLEHGICIRVRVRVRVRVGVRAFSNSCWIPGALVGARSGRSFRARARARVQGWG